MAENPHEHASQLAVLATSSAFVTIMAAWAGLGVFGESDVTDALAYVATPTLLIIGLFAPAVGIQAGTHPALGPKSATI